MPEPAVHGLSIPVRLDAAGHAALVVGALPLTTVAVALVSTLRAPANTRSAFSRPVCFLGGVLSGSDRFTTVMLATHISDYSARTKE